jgi:toxin YoeB
MRIVFHSKAWEHYTYWLETDRAVFKKLNALIKEIQRSPFEGIGKPEPLKHELKGYWSRRITQEHRLVYRVEGNDLIIIQCRYHYD